MVTDRGQVECESITEPEAFEPKAFEKPSED